MEDRIFEFYEINPAFRNMIGNTFPCQLLCKYATLNVYIPMIYAILAPDYDFFCLFATYAFQLVFRAAHTAVL